MHAFWPIRFQHWTALWGKGILIGTFGLILAENSQTFWELLRDYIRIWLRSGDVWLCSGVIILLWSPVLWSVCGFVYPLWIFPLWELRIFLLWVCVKLADLSPASVRKTFKMDSIALIKKRISQVQILPQVCLSKRNRANVTLMLIDSPPRIVTVCALNPGVDYLHVTASWSRFHNSLAAHSPDRRALLTGQY